MASYAPAFGMLGTLLGLINLMDLVGAGDMKAIGAQLAVALVTTFYGVLLANLIFKPIAVKLERRTEQRLVLMNMVLEGISLMCAGRSPALMRETLKAFVAQYDDEIFGRAPDTKKGCRPWPRLSWSRTRLRRSRHPHADPRVSTQGGRFRRWHLEARPDTEEEGWLLTYLDVITLILVMMVVMLAVAGPPGAANKPATKPRRFANIDDRPARHRATGAIARGSQTHRLKHRRTPRIR